MFLYRLGANTRSSPGVRRYVRIQKVMTSVVLIEFCDLWARVSGHKSPASNLTTRGFPRVHAERRGHVVPSMGRRRPTAVHHQHWQLGQKSQASLVDFWWGWNTCQWHAQLSRLAIWHPAAAKHSFNPVALCWNMPYGAQGSMVPWCHCRTTIGSVRWLLRIVRIGDVRHYGT